MTAVLERTVANGIHFDDEELALLALVADGVPADQMARRLCLSERTIRRRLRGLCDRLGLDFPVQVVVWAVRRGLL